MPGRNEQSGGLRTDAEKTPPASERTMNTLANPAHRDASLHGSTNERFLLDTLAERRAPERPSAGARLRAVLVRLRAR